MLGSCRQSMNMQMGAPGAQTRRASVSHSAIQWVQLRWSLASPSKSGKGFLPFMLEYLAPVDCWRAF